MLLQSLQLVYVAYSNLYSMKLINIPNIITCCNLICGCIAIYTALFGRMDVACLFIILGAVFDFFDGMTARALGISGPIGKELDSLADVVSFGIAPSALCFVLLQTCCEFGGFSPLWAFAAFIMAAFSALRLAKFNCDERQSLSFIGLPTPANALFWIGLSQVLPIPAVASWMSANPLLAFLLILLLMMALSFTLICELPMFSLKLKKGHNGFAENRTRYIFLALCALLLIGFTLVGNVLSSFAAIIPLYLVMSIIDKKK